MKLRRAACIAAVLVLTAAACSGDDAEQPDRAGTEGSGKVESGDTDSSTLAEAANGSGTPERLGGGRFSAVAAGSRHTCALRTDGTVECWGLDHAGLLDAPSGGFSSVSASRNHTCAVRTDGTVECWGLDYAGLLDAPDGQFTAVSASPGHSCAIRTGGILECWGTFRPPPEGVTLVERAGE